MAFSACPFCNFSVPTHELQRHANQHFIGEDEARDMEFARRIAHLPPSPSPTNNYISIYEDSAPSSSYVVDARVDTTASGGNRYDQVHASLVVSQRQEVSYKIECDLMVMLRKCLESESGSSRTVLCGYIDHFQSIVSHDHGWGCGWRNIQMLSSHLIKQRQEARQALYGGSGFVPNIESLQRWLELAWEKGFDPPGSDDFDRRVHGTRTWIGTTECAALLRSFGLRARIVDFSTRKAAGVYGPMDRFLSKGAGSSVAVSAGKESDRDYGKGKGHQVLARWVWNYFSSSNARRSSNQHVVLSEKSPLYFQHDGHSRTIVGIQAKPEKNGTLQYNLLILDPSERTRALEKSLSVNAGWQQLIKRGVHTLKKPQYQLCYIDPGIASGEELEELKNIHSVLHEL
ncbi:zinc finger-containing ubiquitin peptidase 1 isoform X1 [Salvia hispanica]|uniref:zinc finger-containing ubiquitin peptidase 1 isoform X1 n=2 Tax=Salvia hispanica TaxID=49212 RepID=UPI002009C46B|nr:zinc finger-containing ubiquitin peptidase 1 isoform X1 [Salvia hispanica]